MFPSSRGCSGLVICSNRLCPALWTWSGEGGGGTGRSSARGWRRWIWQRRWSDVAGVLTFCRRCGLRACVRAFCAVISELARKWSTRAAPRARRVQARHVLWAPSGPVVRLLRFLFQAIDSPRLARETRASHLHAPSLLLCPAAAAALRFELELLLLFSTSALRLPRCPPAGGLLRAAYRLCWVRDCTNAGGGSVRACV